MKENVLSAIRRVPEHKVIELRSIRERHALMIPVVNEGPRIRAQLARLSNAGYPIDIVVADGGSTDGSLDAQFLKSVDVRALLTKTGPGRLSAQMRMGFAWCLDQGYDGVITIDGNGKDGIEAIPDFVTALDEGWDFIQGSRYMPGGLEENTPRDRRLAVQLVHAPLVSIIARHRYTDTTNGFRAQSRRLLEDSRLAIFRDVFMDYNLHYYMSIKAPRLGHRVTEIPVSRRYPPSGLLPSKIRGLKGKLLVLRELFSVALGRCDP